MLRFLMSIGIAACLLASSFAYAAPDSFDSPEWQSFFQKDSTTTLPKGDPNAQGAVSLWMDDDSSWNSKYLQIKSPFNLAYDKDIVLSNYAKDYGLVYASETVKQFLDATVQEMRKIVGDHGISVPVFMLYPELPIPMKEEDENIFGLTLGVFLNTGNGAIPFPDAYLTGSGIQDSDAQDTAMNDINEVGFRYHQFSQYLQDKSKKSIVQDSRFSKNDFVSPRWHIQRQVALRQVAMDWDTIQEHASELDVDNARMLGKANPKTLNAYQLYEKMRQNSDRRRTKYQRWMSQNDSRYEREFNTYLDLNAQMTWYLMQAILTQTAVEVVEIHMPLSLERELLKTVRMDVYKELVDKFEDLVVDDEYGYGGIRILLACSVRDRFLGCPLGGSEATESKVAQISDKLVKTISSARTIEDKVKVIRLVANANPIYLTESLNTDALKQQIEYSLSDDKKEEGLYYLSQFEDIPLKQGDALFIHGVEVPKEIERIKDEPKKRVREGRPKDTAVDLPF